MHSKPLVKTRTVSEGCGLSFVAVTDPYTNDECSPGDDKQSTTPHKHPSAGYGIYPLNVGNGLSGSPDRVNNAKVFPPLLNQLADSCFLEELKFPFNGNSSWQDSIN